MPPQLTALAPLAAALTDPDRLRVYARVVVAGPAGALPDELRADEPGADKHLRRLVQAQLVDLTEEGRAVARADAFATAMRRTAPEEQDEVAGLFRNGRLTAMPTRPALRQALLEHLARTVFEPGVRYTEGEVSIALRQHWDDFSALRRYLVDCGLLTRAADGSSYRVTDGRP
jgi:hypothetical protein